MSINSFTFNGVSSESLGLYVGGQQTFGSPQRDVTKVSIPGRNGDLIRDNGRFHNVPIAYNVVAMSDFKNKAQSVRNWLMSAKGYKRLEDTYHPEHYRMASVADSVDFETGAFNATGKAKIIFDCMPQRFLKSGEMVASGDPVERSASGEIASFETDYVVPLSSAEVSLSPQQDLNGYDSPWPGGGGKNILNPKLYTGGTYNPTVGSQWTLTESAQQFVINDAKDIYTLAFSSSWTMFVMIVPVTDGTTYKFTGQLSSTGNMGTTTGYLDENYTVLSVLNNTSTSQNINSTLQPGVNTQNCAYFYILITNRSSSTATITFANAQIEVGSTATAFSPWENICPISGHMGATLYRTGKNLLKKGNSTTSAGITFTVNEDGTVSATGTSTGTATLTIASPFLKAGTYTLSGCPNGGGGSTWEILMNKGGGSIYRDYGSGRTFTLAEDTTFLNWQIVVRAGQTVDSLMFAPMVELGSTATSYEPYQGDTYSVTFTDQGTVYGGTFDWVSGKLTVTWKRIIADGVSVKTTGGYGAGGPLWLPAITLASADYVDVSILTSGVASYLDWNNSIQSRENTICSGNGGHVIVLHIGSMQGTDGTHGYNSAAEVHNAVNAYLQSNPLEICYKLATPLEYTLSAQQIETLLGENNVWSDAGEISLTFYEPAELDNPTSFDSKPLIRAYGSGNGQVTIGNQIIALTDINGYIDIDCEAMDCYNGVENCNSKVTLGAQGFPTLPPGITAVSFGGGVTKVEITPRWWEL